MVRPSSRCGWECAIEVIGDARRGTDALVTRSIEIVDGEITLFVHAAYVS